MSSNSLKLLRWCSLHSAVYISQDCCTSSHWWPVTQGLVGFTSQRSTEVWGKWAQQAFNLWIWKNPDLQRDLGVELWTPLVKKMLEAQSEARKGGIDQIVCSRSPRTTYNEETMYCYSVCMEAEAWKYSLDQGPRTLSVGMQFVFRSGALNHCCSWPCEHVLCIGMQFGMDTDWNNLVTRIKTNTN